MWYLLTRLPTGQETSVGCCVEELLPKHHTEEGRDSQY
jgi:hypothetical protein